MDLSSLGWDKFLAASLASAGPGLEAGRVAAANRNLFKLWTASGARDAVLSGALLASSERPVTGDWVAYERDNGRIRAVLPRRGCLSRKRPGRAFTGQAIAANVDVLFVVMGLDGDFNPRRLERYLMLAEEGGVSPVVMLNKADLCADPLACLREVDRITRAPAILLSAIEPGSAAQMHRYIEPPLTAALAGSSGAGKSTIVNALLGEPRQPTAAVRESDSRGRHTTTSRDLFLLPQGWLLIDTPGLREIEVWMEDLGPDAAFTGIRELALQCRFRDCRHAGEPGCAVAEAIDKDRLAAYRKLQREADAQLRKRRDRIVRRACRRFQKDREPM